jgi:hypothetical protein
MNIAGIINAKSEKQIPPFGRNDKIYWWDDKQSPSCAVMCCDISVEIRADPWR